MPSDHERAFKLGRKLAYIHGMSGQAAQMNLRTIEPERAIEYLKTMLVQIHKEASDGE